MHHANHPAPSIVSECVQPVVVVSATHPFLGALFWCFFDGSDHNAPNCYTITNRLEDALTLRKGWREGIMAWHYRDHVAKVMGDEDQFDQSYDLDTSEDGTWAQVTTLGGMLKTLQERSGQDVEVFANWLAGAVWLDVAIATRPLDFPDTYVVPQIKPELLWQRLQA